MNSFKSSIFKHGVVTNIIVATLLFVSFISVLIISHPVLIGQFDESDLLYESFIPVIRPWFILEINPTGNSEGGGGWFHSYALLTASRYIADIFGHNIGMVKFLPVFYGGLALFFLYVVTQRWFGRKTAVIATLLCITNQYFITLIHQMVVHSLTLALILFCIERFQNIREKYSISAAITFGFSFAILSLHHVIGRLCLVVILLFYLFDIQIYCREYRKKFFIFIKERYKQYAVVLASFFFFLTVFFPLNLSYLFTKRFLLPYEGGGGEHAGNLHQAFLYFFHNVKFFFYYYLWGSSANNHSADLTVNVPYPLEDKIVILLFAIGFITAIIYRNKYRVTLIASIIGILMIPVLLTTALPEMPFEESSYMNVYRTFHLIPFISIFAALGVVYFYDKFDGKRNLRILIVIMVLMLMTLRVYDYYLEACRQKEYVSTYRFGAVTHGMKGVNDGYSVENSYAISTRRKMYLTYIYYYQLARTITDEINKNKDELHGSDIKLIYVPLQSYLSPYGSYRSKNPPYFFHIFLTFYLQENGLNVSYLINRNTIEIKGQVKKNRVIKDDRFITVGQDLLNVVTDKQDQIPLLPKILHFMENMPIGGNLVHWIGSSHLENLEPVGDKYVINNTGCGRPDFILLTDEDQLHAFDSMLDKNLILQMPEHY